jgi:hypothetical protein
MCNEKLIYLLLFSKIVFRLYPFSGFYKVYTKVQFVLFFEMCSALDDGKKENTVDPLIDQ